MDGLKKVLASLQFRIALGLFVSGIAVYLAVAGVDLAQAGRIIARAHWPLIAWASASVIVNMLLKIARWRLLLDANPGRNHASFAASFLAGQFLNNFFPLRVGEISRVATLGRGDGYAFVATTLLFEKLYDMIAFGVLLLIQALFSLPSQWIRPSVFLFLAAAVLMFMVGVALVRRLDWFAERLPARWMRADLRAALRRNLMLAATGAKSIQNPVTLAGLALLTACIWCMAVLTNHLTQAALRLNLPLQTSVLTLIALQIGISAPSLPGRVGIFEYACMLALQTYGIGAAAALGYGVLLHLIVYTPVLALGLPAFWRLSVRRTSAGSEYNLALDLRERR